MNLKEHTPLLEKVRGDIPVKRSDKHAENAGAYSYGAGDLCPHNISGAPTQKKMLNVNQMDTGKLLPPLKTEPP